MQSTGLLGEAARCVHISDQANDISDTYEPFCMAQKAGTHFVVRTCVNRVAGDGTRTIADEMNTVVGKGGTSQAIREIKYLRIHALPPIWKQKCYPMHNLTVIRHCPG